jgi:hypothetical protein
MTRRDWGRYGLGAAIAGWVVAAFPAVVPAAFALWCLGLAGGVVGWRSRRSGHGLAGLILATVGLAYVLAGVVLGLLLF